MSTQTPLIEQIASFNQQELEGLRALLLAKEPEPWRCQSMVPPGSFVEDIVELFRRETNIPLEIPFVVALSLVSGLLNTVGATYELGGRRYAPKLWTVLLANSGAGKSYAFQKVSTWMTDAAGTQTVPRIQGASSSAKFVENIEATPRGIFIRDEFGQFLQQVQNLQHMEEIKDILLCAYSGDPIERNTKASQITVRDHAFTILGITVGDTFEKQIGAESLVDGFAQRFNYIRAISDPARSVVDFPIFFEDTTKPEYVAAFDRMRNGWLRLLGRNDLPEAVFHFSPDALEAMKDAFRSMFAQASVPESFYRRAMFSIFSYAVVFHCVAGRPGTEVQRDSLSLAARMVALHIQTARQMLEQYGLSALERILQKSELVIRKIQEKNEPVTPRKLVAGVRDIQSVPQARAVLALLMGSEESSRA